MVSVERQRRSLDGGRFADSVTLRFPANALRLRDVGGEDERVRLANVAHLRTLKALARGEEAPVVVTFGRPEPDRPVEALFPGLSAASDEGEQILSAASFITYTMRTLFRRGWIAFDGAGWQLTVPAERVEWRRRARAVLDYLLREQRIYLMTTRRGPLSFGGGFAVEQNVVAVAACDFLDEAARRRGVEMAFNSAFFLLEHDDLVSHHSALGEGHSLWAAGGVIQRPALFRRGAIWQTERGAWAIGLLGPADMDTHLPGGLRLFHHLRRPPADGARGARALPFTLNDEGPSDVTLYTRYYGVASRGRVLGRTPAAPGRLELTAVDRRVVGHREGGDLPLPHNGLIISFAPGVLAAEAWRRLRAALEDGARLDYHFARPEQTTIRQALQTGPILLQGGASPLTDDYLEAEEQFWASRRLADGAWQVGVVPTSYKTDIHETRAGRAGIGITGDGGLVAVLVAGVNEGMGVPGEDSFGATLGELTELLRAAGAVSALNLDGGGSTQVVHEGAYLLVPGDRRGQPGVPYRRLVPAAAFVGG